MKTKTIKTIDTALLCVNEPLPDGTWTASVNVDGWDDVKRLPKVIEINGRLYGRTGWNSDSLVAYYRTDRVFGWKA